MADLGFNNQIICAFHYTGRLSGSMSSLLLIKNFPNSDKDSGQSCIPKEQSWFGGYLKQDSLVRPVESVSHMHDRFL